MSAGGLVTVRTVGGLIPADLLGRIVAGHDLDGLNADDFHLELGVTPKEAANRAWAVLRQAWVNYRAAMAKLPEGDRATGLTREKWLSVLLRELGFGRIPTTPAGGILVDDRSYPVSHEVDQIPIHLLGWGVDLDRRSPGLAGAAARAPHAMVQELLNRSDDHLWAILANGERLRLLRDSANLVGQAFVEFDLETMFDVEVFSDFVALFLLAHQTRFEPVDPEAGIEDCWLERWRSDAVETGARALGQLRDGVKAAIESLGTGFLRHPDNAELRSRLEPDGDLDLATFHRALLRLVYRLLFCFVSEDRGLLLDPAASEETRVRYTTWFSTARLRTIATRRRGTRHDDLWIALRLVLDGLGADEGRPELALPGLGGLFGVTDADPVAGCALGNDALLAAVRHLCVIQPKEGGPRRNIDYQHLGTEELGSIYESLLEFVPRHDSATRTFNLAALSGNDRKTTGAHYTPAPLIDCLLEASLDHLLDEAETGDDPEAVLLAITVCDPAAGSGHFLVAAARRIAHRLARVRSGDDEPSVPTTQSALRDVIAHCVYGIDINPMAVELCKVSLWLEAMEAGKPLSFLDHHVVCGNGLIGATPRLIAGGVPDAAFKAIEGDEKKIVTKRRATNKRERKARGQGLFAFNYGPEVLAEDMARIEQLPDDSAAQVAAKAERFRAMQVDQSTVRARLEADAWCAAFVAEKNVGHPAITDSTVRVAGTNPDGLDPDARDEIEVLRERYRFLHWHLAFPQIYRVDLDDGGEHGWTGGFDLVIGNPPWDTLSPDAKEFFSTYEPEIRFQKGREQEATIARLETIPGIAEAWSAHRRELFALVHFIKASGRYRMFAPGNLGKGDFDMYRMFVETALATSAESGWAAQVVKSGLYNGSNAAGLRKELFESCQLGLLAGLTNRAHHWFSAVHADLGIAVYAARRGGSTQEFRAGFGITDEAGLERLLTDPVWISTKTVRAQSPAALAVSEVKPGPDATIMAKLYEAWPPFGESLSSLLCK